MARKRATLPVCVLGPCSGIHPSDEVDLSLDLDVPGLFSVSISDWSLLSLSIGPGDRLILCPKVYYDDGDHVLCGWQAEVGDPWVYYLGHYRQVGDSITIILPFSEILVGRVWVLGVLKYVVRAFN